MKGLLYMIAAYTSLLAVFAAAARSRTPISPEEILTVVACLLVFGAMFYEALKELEKDRGETEVRREDDTRVYG